VSESGDFDREESDESLEELDKVITLPVLEPPVNDYTTLTKSTLEIDVKIGHLLKDLYGKRVQKPLELCEQEALDRMMIQLLPVVKVEKEV